MLVADLESSRFFKERKDQLDMLNLKELTNSLKFKEVSMDNNVLNYGDHGETFYIIIQGVCSV